MLSVTLWRRTLDPAILTAATTAAQLVGGGAVTTVSQAFDRGLDVVYDVYLVEQADARFVLKRCPDSREADTYRAWFTGSRVPVPALLGHLISDGVDWLALEHVGGTQPRDPMTHARAGDTLGMVHAEFWSGRPWPVDVDEWRRWASAIGDESVWQVERELEVRAAAGPTTLGHGDVQPANVVVHRTGARIVDWALGGRRAYFFDLARYGHLRGVDRQPNLTLQDRAAFLSAYRSRVGSLLPDDERLGRDVLLGQAALFLGGAAAGDEKARQNLSRTVHELS